VGFQEYIAFTILVPCIRSMWHSQLSLCARMKFIMFLCFIFIQLLMSFMRHVPFTGIVIWTRNVGVDEKDVIQNLTNRNKLPVSSKM
jgi:hypothetical protein